MVSCRVLRVLARQWQSWCNISQRIIIDSRRGSRILNNRSRNRMWWQAPSWGPPRRNHSTWGNFSPASITFSPLDPSRIISKPFKRLINIRFFSRSLKLILIIIRASRELKLRKINITVFSPPSKSVVRLRSQQGWWSTEPRLGVPLRWDPARDECQRRRMVAGEESHSSGRGGRSGHNTLAQEMGAQAACQRPFCQIPGTHAGHSR